MPAHDIPYFEPAGGQNAEASSVVKAFGLARSRETASPVPCRYGQGAAGGSSRASRAPARCLAAGSGAARPLLVRAVSQLVPATGSGRDARPGPAPDDRPAPAAVAPGHRRPEGRDPPGRPAPPRPGHRMWAWDGRPSPALSRPWPGRAAARDRPRPGRDRAGMARPGWTSQAPSHVRPCRYRCEPLRRSVPSVTKGPVSDPDESCLQSVR
jgi:hypothetical protein